MTSTDLVRGEIRRFLRSTEPEVICVTGEWGVGKTYTWQAELDEAKRTKALGLTRYSYASLFGINSLEGLKLTLFENLDFLDAPPENYLDKGVGLLKTLSSKAIKLNQLAQGIPAVGPFLAKAGPLYFSLVHNQIVCIDDLERRGNGLELKDVFGLISFLREQRACKVVLLLNAEALADDKNDFDTYFEKVIDTRLVFSPTAAEAVGIALTTSDLVTTLLRGYCEALNISNIRVIKKIERLVRQIVPHLTGFSPEITRQAIHSLVLFGWSKFQPNLAPPLSYYRVSSTERYLTRRKNKEEVSPDDQKWSALLTQYGFTNMDEFDGELVSFLDSGVLDADRIKGRAEEQNRTFEIQKKSGSLEKAWRPFHDSFADNIDEVARSIVDGLEASVSVVSLANLDAAIKLLKELGRQDDAKRILDFFVANKSAEFWDSSSDPFQRGPFDPDVVTAIAAKQAAAIVPFDAEAELIKAAQSYNNETIKKLADVPVDEYYRMIKSKTGDEMRKVILSGLEFRRISNATPEMLEVVRRMEEALKRIGSESELNAVRIGRYGVALKAPL